MKSDPQNKALPSAAEQTEGVSERSSSTVFMRRIGLGLLLIVILLAGLQILEWMESEDDDDAPTDIQKVQPRVIGQTINTGPVLPAQTSDTQQDVIKPTPANPFPVPLPTPLTPPPPPVVDASPTTKSVTTRPISSVEPVQPVVREPLPVSEPPLPKSTAMSPTPVVKPSPAPRLFNNYLVQAGVFSNPQKAQELHALLTLNGIPSTIETRVQVGPFKNKAEADAAREKLKELGIESLLLPPKK